MYKGTGLRCVKTVHFLMCAPWKPPKGFTNTSGFSFWAVTIQPLVQQGRVIHQNEGHEIVVVLVYNRLLLAAFALRILNAN